MMDIQNIYMLNKIAKENYCVCFVSKFRPLLALLYVD